MSHKVLNTGALVKGQSGNQLVYGVRLHEDEVDRFEWRDGYALTADGNANGAALGNRVRQATD